MSKVLDYNSLLFGINGTEIYELFIYKHTETIEYVKK